MLRWAAIILLPAWALPALASPWARGDGELYSRVAISRHDVEGINGTRYGLYSEYGLSDEWTVTLKYERMNFDRFSEFSSDGWRASARRGYALGGGLVVSLEAGALRGEAIGGAAGCQSIGAEARAGIGQSTRIGGKWKADIFWFAEGALRAHDDGCNRQRLEIGYGQRAFQNVWLISQAWFDEGDRNASSSKYQAEYLWRTPAFDVSAGTMFEFGGEFEESAIFLAVARTF